MGHWKNQEKLLQLLKLMVCFYCFTDFFSQKVSIFIILFIVDVHLQAGCSVRLVFIQLDAMSVFFVP